MSHLAPEPEPAEKTKAVGVIVVILVALGLVGVLGTGLVLLALGIGANDGGATASPSPSISGSVSASGSASPSVSETKTGPAVPTVTESPGTQTSMSPATYSLMTKAWEEGLSDNEREKACLLGPDYAALTFVKAVGADRLNYFGVTRDQLLGFFRDQCARYK